MQHSKQYNRLPVRLIPPVVLALLAITVLFNCPKAKAQQLFGMTEQGGQNDKGTIFEYNIITAAYTKKFDFDGANGSGPRAGLMKASNGKLYGMTRIGGTNDVGVIFEFDPATNVYTKKHDFNISNGRNPFGTLTEGPNGKLYGMALEGGAGNGGVLFEFDPATALFTKKLDFTGLNGSRPFGNQKVCCH